MQWPTVVLILGVLTILAIAFLGGKAIVNKSGVELDTAGFLGWILKARESKKADAHVLSMQDYRLPGRLRAIPGAYILWVDDKPLNNLLERRALASIGIFADCYTSNSEAVRAREWIQYDLVISDIGRDGVSETGWNLLDAIREGGDQKPFLFYTSDVNSNLQSQAKARGANGITEDPQELVQLVLQLLSAAP